ncbi:MAG: MMPL family transporter [Myxococcales bacterium]|nr:MMPL family transporter [Myxococcales bacterium]
MRHRVEAALESLGRLVHDHALAIVLLTLLAIVLGATQIPKIEIRVSTDEFLRRDDPVRMEYDAFLTRFGRDDVLVVAIEPDALWSLDFLERLRSLHEELEEGVPYLRDIQSLVNARETRGVGDELIVGELLEAWPESEADVEDVRRRALANPLYEGFLLSSNGRLTTITLELEAFEESADADDLLAGFGDAPSEGGAGEDAVEADAPNDPPRLTGQQEAQIVAAVDAILARHDGPGFRIYAGGAPVLNGVMMASMIRDIVLFTLLSIGAIAFFLGLVFRRVVAIVLPLLVAILSVVATLGLMGGLGIPAMPVSEIVPSFLLAVGVGGVVHLLVIFHQRLDAGATRRDAIAGSLGHSGLPIVMTSLTTAGGLVSFTTAELIPIAVFGTVAPLGILVTLLLTLLLTPALLALLPYRASRAASEPEPPVAPSIAILTRMGAFATANSLRVVGVASAMLVLAVVGMLRLYVSFDTLSWFPDDTPAKIATRKIDSELGGAMGLELLIETGAANGMKEPELLHRVDRARHTVERLQVEDVIAGHSVSLVDVVKEIHQALNGGRPAARVVPDDRELIAQELLLFESSGTDDLEDVVDTEFRIGRFTMRVPMVDGSQYPAFADEVERIFDETLDGRGDAALTGLMVVMGRSFVASIETLMRSYAMALAIITPLMMLLLGSFRLGLISMIPNLFPILMTLGLMGWLGVPIELFSLLIGSIALGLAVDDTIHFMHGFRRNYGRTGDVDQAVASTLRTTGQAMLFTSVVLSVAFATYYLSELKNLKTFGLLTAFAIVMAFLADVLLAPALMHLTARFSSLRRDS